MKKRIYYFYIILISLTSFINQERIAFAETANTPTNEFLNKKEDKRSIKAKDSEIYAGDLWNPKDNFVSATDENGNPVYWGDSRITCTGTVDVSKPGINEIEYRITRNGNVIRSKAKVRVKEDKSSIKTKDSEKYVGNDGILKKTLLVRQTKTDILFLGKTRELLKMAQVLIPLNQVFIK